MMSLNVDPGEWKQKEKVLKFLTDQKADFPNYIFQDAPENVGNWLEKHEVAGTPQFVAFDRTGRRVPVPDFASEADETAFIKKLLGK
jgi:hypothetical protein